MGYYITIKNELLEPKHVIAIGPAVWLCMWLIDKVMAINENGIGKVLNGKPVLYADIEKDLGISQRTYQRWVKQLEIKSYICTIRTPYGQVITISKAAKMWGQKAQSNNAQLFTSDSNDKNGTSKVFKKT